MIRWQHLIFANILVGVVPRAVSFSGKSSFCRGGAPVPALPVHDFVSVSGIGATTGGLSLQENETALPVGPYYKIAY